MKPALLTLSLLADILTARFTFPLWSYLSPLYERIGEHLQSAVIGVLTLVVVVWGIALVRAYRDLFA
jgi:hypothetical protein